MQILIQKATQEDIPMISNIEGSLSHRILSNNLLSSTISNDNYYYFIAKINEQIIGYIAAEFMVDHFDLLSIAVLEEYRNKNVATLLLKELFKTCNELQIKEIFLEVRHSNIPAISFYEKAGFKNIGTRKNYYSDTNEDAHIYKIVV